MSRINTNVSSLIAQRVLTNNNNNLGLSLERLSTGLRINRGKDDPAGLIASENLRAEKSAIGAAIKNAERADQVVNIAEGGLTEISGLLNELQGLITASANTAGLSSEEKEANQLKIDSILQTIDRVASATSFQGSKLLNGNYGYAATDVSGAVSSFKINGAKLNQGDTRNVEVLVTQSAQRAGLFLSTATNAIDLGAGSTFVIEITGTKGSREFSFASGTALSTIADTVNSFKDVLGVSATDSGTGLRIDSVEFGEDEFVSVKISDDGSIAGANVGIYQYAATDTNTANTTILSTFTAAANKVTDIGQDLGATINGIVATTNGTIARINTDFLDVEVDLSSTAGTGANAQTLGAIDAFTITGGGASFQLAAQVDIAGKVSLGIDNVAVRNIGQAEIEGEVKFLSDLSSGKGLDVVDGDLTGAQKVVEKAIREVSQLRGRLGAFQQNTIGATVRSLNIGLENTTAAESIIRDADFAFETADLTRNQILSASAQQILGLANSQPQAALQLLG
ncbi:MAG: flagellin [Phycisphaeraceae bacterium]|nr:flagellin [Phycisphaerales bacterium]MCA9306516.1 flagellin [Phycisphaerales bacterium]MCB9843788.1 flagellin [Phycisphaeraceae bacterium]